MSLSLMIPLLILTGLFSALLASFMGLGSGIVGIPLILLIIGGNNNLSSKLISFVSIATLSIVSLIKYSLMKRKPNISIALWILIGALPLIIVSELYISPLLITKSTAPYFHLIYAVIIIIVFVLINITRTKTMKLIKHNYYLPFIGGIVGVLSGSLGLSGGVLFIPLLVLGLGYSLKDAAVTSLAIKLPVVLINIITAASSGQYEQLAIDGLVWYLPLIISIGAIIGALIGPRINKHIKHKNMSLIFNIVMVSLFVLEILHFVLLITNVI